MSSSQGVQGAKDAVLVKSEPVHADIPVIKGYDFNQGTNYDELIKKMLYTGYQASHLGKAVDIIDQMLTWRLSHVPQTEEEIADELALPVEDRTDRANTKATIFLGYTSNLVSSGLREVIRYLCEHKLISAIVSTAGGVEEDFIKCLAPTYLSEFSARGVELRAKGLNRIGNLVVPNDNYCKFEDWLTPILDAMLEEQKQGKVQAWTPSMIINRLGKEIDNKESIYYWCYKNDIPVFCPAITDGSLGDMMFFHSLNKPGLTVDILDDLRKVNNMAIQAHKTGMIILVRHLSSTTSLMSLSFGEIVFQVENSSTFTHLSHFVLFFFFPRALVLSSTTSPTPTSCATVPISLSTSTPHRSLTALMLALRTYLSHLSLTLFHDLPRHVGNPLTYLHLVFITFPFSSPDEAVSWGKISAGAQSVKVCADATIVFPLMVAQTFAKHKALRDAEAAATTAAEGSTDAAEIRK